MAISFEQVAATADKIRANNLNPTCQNVREVLGTGSMATISKLLRRYKNEQPTTETSSVVQLPETLKKGLFDELERYAAERVGVVREELNEALQTIESIESEFETLDALCVEKNAIIEEGAKRLEEVDSTNDEQARRIRSLIEERADLKALSDSLTLNLAESKADLSAVERERDIAQKLNKTQYEKIELMADKNTAQAIEVQRLTTTNANIETQHNEKSNALTKALKALEVKNSEFEDVKKQHAVLESQMESANERRQEQKEAIKKLELSIQEQKSEHKEEMKRREKMHADSKTEVKKP